MAGQAFEHYSTDPGLLCDCGQLTAEDTMSLNTNDKIVLSIVSLNKPFTFPSAIKFTSSVGQTVKKKKKKKK